MGVDVGRAYAGVILWAKNHQFDKTRPEHRILRDRVTVTVASDVGSAGSPLEKQFHQASSQPNQLVRTKEPAFMQGGVVGEGFAVALLGIRLRMNLSNYAGTLNETREVLDALGDAELVVRNGSKIIEGLGGRDVLVGSPGFINSTDTATATATARSPLEMGATGYKFINPPILAPGSSLASSLFINKTVWTANDNFDLFLEFEALLLQAGMRAANDPTQDAEWAAFAA